MNYILTLILEKKGSEEKTLKKIKKYLEEKEGRLLEQKTKGNSVYSLEIELYPQEVEKLKRKVQGEKEVVTYLLEKKKEAKKIKEKKIKTRKAPVRPKENKAKKVITSMREEEKKIKDLDSTLDKILNE